VPRIRFAVQLLAILLVLAGCQSMAPPTPTAAAAPTATPTPTAAHATRTPRPADRPASTLRLAPTGPTQEAAVVRVVDGDTIIVRLGSQDMRLRYIGIDTPETVRPGHPVEWLGPEASEANRRLVEGRTAVLEKDVSETDRFGRLLRYVWLRDDDDWLMVNHELVRLGYAQVTTIPPDVKYADLFLEAQREAREAGRGLWAQRQDQ
jgi:micrococcal nuclease